MSESERARLFVEQLSAVLPQGFQAGVRGDRLWLAGIWTSGASVHWLSTDVLLEDEAINGAVQMLDQIQSHVAHATREPWPAVTGPGYAGFPEPNAEMVGDEIRMWFGDRERPVLELGPIASAM